MLIHIVVSQLYLVVSIPQGDQHFTKCIARYGDFIHIKHELFVITHQWLLIGNYEKFMFYVNENNSCGQVVDE